MVAAPAVAGSRMPRATVVAREGTPESSVTLVYDDRHRRRLRLVTDGGCPFLLDLPDARVLRDGDVLTLDDGTLVLVRAAAEPVLDIRAADAPALARLAWHLGNRHTPTQVLPGALRIRADHVLKHLLTDHLGASVTRLTAPFDPEGGAYGGGHHHDR
jgi:urease accessory protein